MDAGGTRVRFPGCSNAYKSPYRDSRSSGPTPGPGGWGMEEPSTRPPKAEEPDANKRKKTLVIVLVLVLILAAIGIGIVAVLSSQPPAAPQLGTLLASPHEVALAIR